MTDKILRFPDRTSEITFTDDDGEVWYMYEVQYEHENKHYAFEIMATSEDDALARIGSIRHQPLILYKIIAERN